MRLKKMQGYGSVTKQPSHASCTRDVDVGLVDTVTNSRWAWNAAFLLLGYTQEAIKALCQREHLSLHSTKARRHTEQNKSFEIDLYIPM